jgi:RNA polymerase sigma factor (sigma-70 family)
MNLKLVKSDSPPTHEEIFVEKFSKIRLWAMQLAEREKDVADDLVQDAYVQFTLSAPDLSEINNLDGYIYGVLRNLRLSQIRRDARQRLTQLSTIEYDSASEGLQTIDWRDQFLAQDELRRVCAFLCDRKETARMASILILRFFHAYFPSEISQILRTSRSAIDVRLLMARKEVKAFLEDPASVAFINLKPAEGNFEAKSSATSDEFINDLRRMIFSSRRGDCLTENFLDSFYTHEKGALMEVAPVAHLASCARCLEKVNTMLNLPKLNDRFPDDALGRDKKKSKDSGAGGDDDYSNGGGSGDGENFISVLQRKARRVFEHKPSELRVAVNGAEKGSLRIGGETNKLNLNVDSVQTGDFVEVFSEQNLRLLMLNVEDVPPAGKSEVVAETVLSDERNLSARLRFNAQGATLQLVYVDPTFREMERLMENSSLLDELEQNRQISTVKITPSKKVESGQNSGRRRFSGENWQRRISEFFASYFRLSNRGLAFASVFVLLVAGFAALQFLPAHRASAAERILQASEAASRQFDGIIYRRLKRTVITPDSTRALEAEKWRDAKNDLIVTRYYSEKGEVFQETHYSLPAKNFSSSLRRNLPL